MQSSNVMSAYMQHVKAYTGTTHFSWLRSLQESPDYIESWEPDSPSSHHSERVKISYPEETNPGSLIVNSLADKEKHGLGLASLTSFDLPAGAINYFGLHHYNAGETQQELSIIFTMNDGSFEKYNFLSAKQGDTRFSGFVTKNHMDITHIDIVAPEGSSLSIDDLQWGSFGTKQLPCNMQPELVQWQCDNNQWLMDIKVRGDSSVGAWWCSDDKDEQCGSYNESVSYGYYKKSDIKQVALAFTDQNNKECSKTITVQLPENCNNNCSYHLENGAPVETCEVEGNLVMKTEGVEAAKVAVINREPNDSNNYHNTLASSEAFFQKAQPHLNNKASRPVSLTQP